MDLDMQMDTLLQMGFGYEESLMALESHGFQLEQAMDWLLVSRTQTGLKIDHTPILDGEKRYEKGDNLIDKDRNNSAVTSASSSTPLVTMATSSEQPQKRSCKLQLRLPSGKKLIEEFAPTQTLNEVRAFLRKNGVKGEFFLETGFLPKRSFSYEDCSLTLEELGLVPSAVLMVTTCQPEDWFKTSEAVNHDNAKSVRMLETEERKRNEEVRKKYVEEVQKNLKEEKEHRDNILREIKADKEARKRRFFK